MTPPPPMTCMNLPIAFIFFPLKRPNKSKFHGTRLVKPRVKSTFLSDHRTRNTIKEGDTNRNYITHGEQSEVASLNTRATSLHKTYWIKEKSPRKILGGKRYAGGNFAIPVWFPRYGTFRSKEIQRRWSV